jgi:hypothetical protein
MKLSVKNMKTMRSRDGYDWSCDLYIDGVKAAYVHDFGNGGPVDFEWYRKDLRQPFLDYVETLPESDTHEFGMVVSLKPDAGSVVAQLCDDLEMEKKLKNWCKTKTVVKMKKDLNNPAAFTTFKHPYGPDIKNHIIKKYGDEVAEFVNERFL